jgi:23S rRNA pseudouridine1911/1915/1917 synthase
MPELIQRSAVVPAELSGQRLDQVAVALFPEWSRSRLQAWIRAGALTVNGSPARPRDRLQSGEALVIDAQLEPVDTEWKPEERELDIVFEDDQLLVVAKPAGLVVHPAAGHREGTLLNALLGHCPALESVPRAGIVHRLDKDTTGLMVVAKTLTAQARLVAQLQARTVHRQYDAVVVGVLVSGGTVNAAMGRHAGDRKRMAVLEHGGKTAVTHYRVQRRFRGHTHVTCLLETGRTHQIRVHMAHIRHPLIGDPLYGGRPRLPAGASAELMEALKSFPRQALHARRLELVHPVSGEPMAWEIPLPADMLELLAVLKRDQEEMA